MTDEEILLSFYHGNGAAFGHLYNRYAARGIRYAYSFLQNESDSEEAVQEAFCRLLKPLGRGTVKEQRGGFCAVFFSTLRNLCIDMLRKRKFRNHLPLDSVPEPCSEPAETDHLEEQIQDGLKALPPHQGEALKLRLNSELTYDQIAEVLACTRAQVRTWIYRARRTLEQRFRKEGLIMEKE